MTGHWEVSVTSWGVPIEDTSTIKAKQCNQRYKKGIIANSKQCLGSYIFLWGQKQERTPTWYGLFTEDGKLTETVDVISALWMKTAISIKAPQIKSFFLEGKMAHDNIMLNHSEVCFAVLNLKISDNNNKFKWELLPESTDLKEGGDKEQRPMSVELQIVSKRNNNLTFIAPSKGIYRLYVYVSNELNRVATANIPFIVT
jgi:hypothetical protein